MQNVEALSTVALMVPWWECWRARCFCLGRIRGYFCLVDAKLPENDCYSFAGFESVHRLCVFDWNSAQHRRCCDACLVFGVEKRFANCVTFVSGPM